MINFLKTLIIFLSEIFFYFKIWNPFLLSLAIAPPLLIIYYIKKLIFMIKNLDKLIKAFLFGVLSTLPSYVILTYVTIPVDNILQSFY